MNPRPTVFIVNNPMELVPQPDLAVFLSDFRVLAETPDYIIFDLTRRATARGPTTNQMARAEIAWSLHPIPAHVAQHWPRDAEAGSVTRAG